MGAGLGRLRGGCPDLVKLIDKCGDCLGGIGLLFWSGQRIKLKSSLRGKIGWGNVAPQGSPTPELFAQVYASQGGTPLIWLA